MRSTRAPSASSLKAVEGGLRLCASRTQRPCAASALLELLPSRCGPRLLVAVDAAATLSTGSARKGAGRSSGTCQGRRRRQRPAHARSLPEAWNAEGRAPPSARARPRPHPRVPTRAGRGFPACACCRSRSGACARYLGPTLVAGFPRFQAPAPRRLLSAPSQPVPSLSSRNGAGATWGRAPGTRLALGLALSATARLAPPRALPQSVAPEAPLSGDRGSCFRFFLSLRSGVASSTQPPLPLPHRWAAAAEGCGGGGGDAKRRRPLLPPRVRGR